MRFLKNYFRSMASTVGLGQSTGERGRTRRAAEAQAGAASEVMQAQKAADTALQTAFAGAKEAQARNERALGRMQDQSMQRVRRQKGGGFGDSSSSLGSSVTPQIPLTRTLG
jgi:hypothetical protein